MRNPENPVADDPEPAGTLRYEEIAFGREGHRERTHQAVGHLFHPEIVKRGPDDAVVVACRVRTARSTPGDGHEEEEEAQVGELVHLGTVRPGCL